MRCLARARPSQAFSRRRTIWPPISPRRYPQAVRFDSGARILDDPNIALVASAGVNADRAVLGIDVMSAGKDFMSDKPGIFADIASHQIEQFLFFTGTEDAEVAVATVGNRANPAHPELQDFGDMLLRTSGVTGYVRVDWLTPDGLPTGATGAW